MDVMKVSIQEYTEFRNRTYREFWRAADSEVLELYRYSRGELSLDDIRRWTESINARDGAVASYSETVQSLVDHFSFCNAQTIRALAVQYRPFLEDCRGLRADSTDLSALRAFQRFLAEAVYPCVPPERLPARIRAGREAASRRRRKAIAAAPNQPMLSIWSAGENASCRNAACSERYEDEYRRTMSGDE